MPAHLLSSWSSCDPSEVLRCLILLRPPLMLHPTPAAVARVLGVLAPAFHPVYRLMHGARTTVADALATQPELLSEEGDDVAAIAAGMRFLGQLLEQQAGLQQTADAAAATAQKALEEVEKLKSQMKDGQLAR